MDPQQRLLLEHGYAALHGAGLDGVCRGGGGGPLVGVYVGLEHHDWSESFAFGALGASVYAATGGAVSVASGRLSFALGLEG
eukprot:6785296-Prymnesium_polylepis.1